MCIVVKHYECAQNGIFLNNVDLENHQLEFLKISQLPSRQMTVLGRFWRSGGRLMAGFRLNKCILKKYICTWKSLIDRV